LKELLKQHVQHLWFWGESAFPFFFHMLKFLELCGEKAVAAQCLVMMFLAAVNGNSHEDRGLPSPYHGPEAILELTLGLQTEPLDPRQFVRNSYILEALILMMARRNGRQILEENWRKLSHISLYSFIPDRVEDTYTYLTEYGANHRVFPKETQSWKELVKEAQDLSSVPPLFQETKDLIRFLIIVLPHRVNKTIIGMLDGDSECSHLW